MIYPPRKMFFEICDILYRKQENMQIKNFAIVSARMPDWLIEAERYWIKNANCILIMVKYF